MNKTLTALVVALLGATAASADVAPPPPPKGKKYVTVNSEVVLGKDVTGYVFVKQTIAGPGRPTVTYSRLDLTAGKPVPLSAGARTFATLFAVPQDAAKEFKTDAELFDALGAAKVKGAHSFGSGGTATVSDKVKDGAVKWTYTITAIDAKGGIKTKVEGEGYEAPAPKKGKEPTSLGSAWAAGGAAALAVVLGGLWVAGRARRKL